MMPVIVIHKDVWVILLQLDVLEIKKLAHLSSQARLCSSINYAEDQSLVAEQPMRSFAQSLLLYRMYKAFSS